MAEISVTPPDGGGRLHRIAETDRPTVAITVDGRPVAALTGDSLLVAVLAAGRAVRQSEFGDGPRAGFCMMGACQDCWMWTADGGRIRACTTPVREGLALLTHQPEAALWPLPA